MKKLNKLIGLKKEEFDKYIKPDDIKLKPQIYARPARLIPTHKTGDEMALSSIFLASLRLVKQFRDSIFKQIKFSKIPKNLKFSRPPLSRYREMGILDPIGHFI